MIRTAQVNITYDDEIDQLQFLLFGEESQALDFGRTIMKKISDDHGIEPTHTEVSRSIN